MSAGVKQFMMNRRGAVQPTPAQRAVLEIIIARQGQRIRFKEIAHDLGISIPAAAGRVQRLYEKGLLRRGLIEVAR